MQKVVQLLSEPLFIGRKSSSFIFRSLLITSLIFCFAFKANSQDLLTKKISLIIKAASPKEALLELQKQSGVRILFGEYIDKYATIKVNMNEKNISFKDAIEQILKNTGLHFIQVDKSVMIEEKSAPKSPNVLAGSDPGTLKGRIVEFETSQPLPGATVYIVELQKGMQSNMDGYYTFSNIPAGKHTLQVSFIGYNTQKVDVEVKTGKEEIYDVKLQGNNNLKEVVVAGTRKSRAPVSHTSDRQLVEELKNAQSVVSGISSEQISKSADRNASEVVRKIAGVSVRDDKFIVIRGLNERYNLTYLNGNIAPSTELYSRAFSLDLIPTRIIDRILIYKSPAPDLLGDMTGGAVKIFTKDAKNVKHFDIEVQTGYRPNTTFNSKFLTYQGGKFDFLGFDDGTRKLPSTVPGYGDFTKATISQQTYAKSFSPILQYGYMTGLPLIQLTANYYNSFKVGNKNLSVLGSINYKNESQQNDVDRLQSAFNTSGFRTHNVINETQSQQTAQITWLQNFSYKLSDSSTLAFKNFILQQGQSSVVDRTQDNSRVYGYYVNGNGSAWGSPDNVPGWYDFQHSATESRNIILSYTQRFLYAGNLSGTHAIGHTGKSSFQWNTGYTFTRQDIPDQRVVRLDRGRQDYRGIEPNVVYPYEWTASVRTLNTGADVGGGANDVDRGIISRTWSRNTEQNYNASADYTYKWKPWLTFKAGTYQQWKERVLFRRVYTLNEGDLNSSGYPNNALLAADGRYMDYNLVFFKEQDLGKVWSTDYLRDDGSALKVFDRTSGSDAYTATEQNNSGYLAASLRPYGGKLDIYGGLRVEYDRQKVAGAIPDGTQLSPTPGGLNNPVLVNIPKLDFLPSVNVGYRPNDKWIIRGSYGKTVNRPEFRELSPYSELDYLNNQVIYGNSNLRPAQIDNYDLRAEWYPGPADQGNSISVGAFYKDMQNPIERVLNRDLNFSKPTYISFGNAQKGDVQGLEVDLRQQLGFLGIGLFRKLSIIANGTFIKSQVTKRNNVNGNDTSTYKRALQGQAPYIVNAGLYYDNAGSGTKIALIYNYIGPRIYAAAEGVPFGTTGGTYVDGGSAGSLIELSRGQLDLSITQRLVKSLQIKFAVQNILNQAIQMAEDENFTFKYEKAVFTPQTNVTKSSVTNTYTITGDPIASSYKPNPYYYLTLTWSF